MTASPCKSHHHQRCSLQMFCLSTTLLSLKSQDLHNGSFHDTQSMPRLYVKQVQTRAFAFSHLGVSPKNQATFVMSQMFLGCMSILKKRRLKRGAQGNISSDDPFSPYVLTLWDVVASKRLASMAFHRLSINQLSLASFCCDKLVISTAHSHCA